MGIIHLIRPENLNYPLIWLVVTLILETVDLTKPISHNVEKDEIVTILA